MAAIVAGGVLLSWGGGLALNGFAGPLLVAAAFLSWAVDNNLTQKVSAGDPVEIAGPKGLVAGTVTLVAGLALGYAVPAAPRLAGALILGFLGYGLSLVLYVLAMSTNTRTSPSCMHIGTPMMSITSTATARSIRHESRTPIPMSIRG